MIAFPHGVASGDPTTSGAVLWTRVAGSAGPVELSCCVGVDADGAAVVRTPARSSPERDHTVHVEVDGLAAGQRYRYWFEAGGVRSRTGSFRTLRDDPTVFTVAVVSCAKYNAGYFNAYRGVARRDDLDVVVHLGDYIYEAANVPPRSQTPGAGIGRDLDPPHECRTLADYRRRYAQYRADPDLQELHARHAVVATIDDHELADNAWAGGADEHRDAEHGPWSRRVRDALTAWEEWTPTRRRPATRGEPIHRSLVVGSLVTVALLETRLHRSDPGERDPAKRTQLGVHQLAWFRDLAGTCRTRWLVTGIPSTVTPLWSPGMDEDALSALRTLKLVEPDERRGFHDLWDAYAQERERLLGALEASRAARLVLSGDVHVAIGARLDRNGRTVAREWTTSSVTSQNLDDKRGWPRRTFSLAHEDAVRRSHPQIDHCNFDDHGYLIVRLDAAHAAAEWWAVESVLTPTAVEYRSHTAVVSHEEAGGRETSAAPASGRP